MDDCGGLVVIGLIFAFIMVSSMGADPLMSIIVFSIMYASVCLT